MTKRLHRLAVLFIAAVSATLILSGCASSGQNAGSTDESSESESSSAAPASSPLSKIVLGMSHTEVREELGTPNDSNTYLTGKQWIPFYYGPDTSREEWIYSNQGRVVFSRNRYSGSLKVINVIYAPDQL